MGGRQDIDWRDKTKVWLFIYSLPAGHALAVAVFSYKVTAPVGLTYLTGQLQLQQQLLLQYFLGSDNSLPLFLRA